MTIKMPEETTEPKKKYVTLACTVCRRRKVKCDGKTPSCSNCQTANKHCEYVQEDGRSKSAPRKLIKSLISRGRLLEALLESNGIEVPPLEPSLVTHPLFQAALAEEESNEQVSTTAQHQEIVAGPSDVQPQTLTTSSETDPSHNPADEAVFDGSGDGFFLGTAPFVTTTDVLNDLQYPQVETASNQGSGSEGMPDNMIINELFDVSTRMKPRSEMGDQRRLQKDRIDPYFHPPASSSKMLSKSSPRAPSDEIMDKLSARMGSFQIAEDGQLRYFGATSNLHILHNGSFSLSRYPTRSVQVEGPDVLERAGLTLDVEPEVEFYLERLYFAWEDPAIHVVDEEMYFTDKERWISGDFDHSYYSDTLKNAICAVAANLTSRSDLGIPSPAAEFFSARAKALLEIEMDCPTVATVQTLVIMSATEAAFTRDARGWLYSGMAVRLSADLGLHLDYSVQNTQEKLSARDIDVRQTTLRGVYIHECMWALYMGRSGGNSAIGDMLISRPLAFKDQIRPKMWKQTGDALNDEDAEHNKFRLYDPIEACTDWNVKLANMMAKLSETLYSGKNLSAPELRSFLGEMTQMFDDWATNLPTALQVDLTDQNKVYLPHVLQLHMQFCTIKIFLFRPLFAEGTVDSSPSSTQLSSRAREASFEAALASAKLLARYREQFSLRRVNVHMVHLVFTTALIHIFEACTNTGSTGEQAMNSLQICTQALSEIGQAYRNSVRALEVIIGIKREWQRVTQSLHRKRARSKVDSQEEKAQEMRRKHMFWMNYLRASQWTSTTADGGDMEDLTQGHNDLTSADLANYGLLDDEVASSSDVYQQQFPTTQGSDEVLF